MDILQKVAEYAFSVQILVGSLLVVAAVKHHLRYLKLTPEQRVKMARSLNGKVGQLTSLLAVVVALMLLLLYFKMAILTVIVALITWHAIGSMAMVHYFDLRQLHADTEDSKRTRKRS